MRALPLLMLMTSVVIGCDDDGGNNEEETPAECTAVVAPSDNDAETIQTAFIEATSDAVICLRPGTYMLDRELSLANARNVTVKGIGETRDDVVLDFKNQTIGDDGVVVTATGFTIENLSVKNTPGNGVVAHAEESTFRNLKVWWDAGSVRENGFYAVYPTDCQKAIIEDTEVIGASDAGIYVGSCQYVIVRRNKVHGNVAGLEIENSLHADVYDNEVYDNTAGILALALPKLAIHTNRYVLIRNNKIYDNNRSGFAEPGTTVSYVPRGIGVLSLAGQDIEMRDNEINDNKSAAIFVVSYQTLELLTQKPSTDPLLERYLKNIYIHDNTYAGNGQDPAVTLRAFSATFSDVVWDGIIEDGKTVDDTKICLGASPASFMNVTIADDETGVLTDTTGHTCTLDPLPEMQDFAGVE